LALQEVQLEFLQLELHNLVLGTTCNDVFHKPVDLCLQVLSIEKNIVFLDWSTWLDYKAFNGLVGVSFIFEISLDFDVVDLDLAIAISASILDHKTKSFQHNWIRQSVQALKLNFNHEEVFAIHSVILWINTGLQHFELALGTDFNIVLHNEGAILESCWHVLCVREIRYFSILNEELGVPQLVQVVFQPGLH
jgi:hypothetical protein